MAWQKIEYNKKRSWDTSDLADREATIQAAKRDPYNFSDLTSTSDVAAQPDSPANQAPPSGGLTQDTTGTLGGPSATTDPNSAFTLGQQEFEQDPRGIGFRRANNNSNNPNIYKA